MTASMATDLPDPELADHGKHFAFIDLEGNAIDRPELAGAGLELDVKVLDFEKGHFVTSLSALAALYNPEVSTGGYAMSSGPIYPIS